MIILFNTLRHFSSHRKYFVLKILHAHQFTYICRNFYILKMADDMQGESGLNTSEDENDFEIVNDGNENM